MSLYVDDMYVDETEDDVNCHRGLLFLPTSIAKMREMLSVNYEDLKVTFKELKKNEYLSIIMYYSLYQL